MILDDYGMIAPSRSDSVHAAIAFDFLNAIIGIWRYRYTGINPGHSVLQSVMTVYEKEK